jgi:Tol biopolymer transport system component
MTVSRSRILLVIPVIASVLGACAAAPAGSISPASPATASSSATSGGIDLSSLTGRILFSAGPAHSEDVYSVAASGSGVERLTTDPAADFDPSGSPDGRVAYRHQPGDGYSTDIFVINADGTGSHNITASDGVSDWGPAWSPDGSRIAWNSDRDDPGRLHGYLMNPDGSGVQAIGGKIWVEYPAWSPDGTRIAFMAQEPGASGDDPDYNITVMNADGSGITKLTDFPGDDGFPAWSPDGTKIAFSSTRDDDGLQHSGAAFRIYVMNADGSDQTLLVDTFGQFADWSPDGHYIVFDGADGFNVIRVDGSGLTSISLGLGYAAFPDWTQ